MAAIVSRRSRRRYSSPMAVRPPIAMLVLTALLLVAAAPAAAQRRLGTVTITVTAGMPTENAFTVSRAVAAVGTVDFVVVNRGELPHAFSIGGKQTVTYTRSGTFRYQCDLHWIQGQMIGTITVTQ